ncbi:putative cytochrome P450 6a14 [Osmia lignaria lignaria]|uniref:putative cytochrome P450 6a14 n=1 Tax=Osmia lignaria lignaria TaxID=1437193 RepID=UPI001478FEAD|nr:probable cytochrome P450 6a14 [Osmia lignaria]
MTGFELLCGLVLIFLTFYYYLVRDYDFWKRRGISGPKPVPLFGNFMNSLLGKISLGDEMVKYYKQYKHLPVVGLFIRNQRVLGIIDPDIIKTILIKDFSKFADRGLRVNKVAEPLSQHLFSLETKRWRPLRTKLSPIFTSGKLKDMFSLILECSVNFEKYLDTLVAEGKPIDCRELTARFTTDVIGSCSFGIDANAMSQKESKFREIGRQIFYPGWKQIFRMRLRESLPKLYTLIGYILPHDEMTKFFTEIVLDTIEYRKKNNIVRHDFINKLMELQAHSEKLGDIELTDTLLAAQAFVFFAAGFETSAATIANALYELALNQKLQIKVREEIREHYALNNGEWPYENINDMPLLDAVFKETLRKYPPITIIMRKAEENYTFEDLKLTIPKGTRIFIPSYAMQHDPEIYPDPEVFDINRFTADAVAKRHPMHYIPFGDGPRNCIGARFALFQTKIGLIKVLLKYKVDTCEETRPYEIEPRSFLLAPKNTITLKMSKLTVLA